MNTSAELELDALVAVFLIGSWHLGNIASYEIGRNWPCGRASGSGDGGN